MDMKFFDPATLPYYLIGFLVFVIGLLDDIINPKKTRKKFLYYLQEFMYTLISIALGISICYTLETDNSVSWIVSIMMGMFGSSVIRKFKDRKETICDKIVDKIEDRIDDKLDNADSLKKK